MRRAILTVLMLLLVGSKAEATFISGSTGADGAFNPTANAVLQLPPDGVFNFTTVNIPSGVTVTFTKNAANTPVYMLTTGDVVINGTLNVSGSSYSTNKPGTGGPGGYDGGYGGASGAAGGNGLGPGGGKGGTPTCYQSGGGSFGELGGRASCTSTNSTYGNARLFPLIGGSGGGGRANETANGGGGGGGGAILIASSTTITINGSIAANGGNSLVCGGVGGGSGGGIKLIANSITGTGTMSAYGGTLQCTEKGGAGRIRLEAYTNNYISGTNPPFSYGQPGSVFVANTPSLQITSIAGVNAPASPTGSYAQPDLMLPSTTANPITINLVAQNIPIGTIVAVSAIPQYGSASSTNATLSGTDASSTASASVTVSTQYASVITAQATYTLQTAMFWEGEKIEHVRIAAAVGSKPDVVYITEKGKEVKAEQLVVAGLLKE